MKTYKIIKKLFHEEDVSLDTSSSSINKDEYDPDSSDFLKKQIDRNKEDFHNLKIKDTTINRLRNIVI